MTQRNFYYFPSMFVRKKRNKSVVISVQVISKEKWKSKLIKTIGSSVNETEIEQLFIDGRGDKCEY